MIGEIIICYSDLINVSANEILIDFYNLIGFKQKDRWTTALSVIINEFRENQIVVPAEIVGKVKGSKNPHRLGAIKIKSDQNNEKNNEAGRAPLYVVTGVIDNDDHMPSKGFQPKALNLWEILKEMGNQNKEEAEESFVFK